MNLVEIIVTDVPARIRTSVVRDAKRQHVSVNEIVCRILADLCNVEREPRTPRFVSVRSTDRMLFTVPAEVRTCLRMNAAVNGATMRGLVIQALAEHYDLPAPSPERRPRSRK